LVGKQSSRNLRFVRPKGWKEYLKVERFPTFNQELLLVFVTSFHVLLL